MTPDGSRLRIDTVEGSLTVSGEIDAHSCTELDAALDGTDGSAVAVDLSGVTFIDSSGLRVLIDHHRRLDEAGGQLRILRPSRTVQRLFEIAGLDGQFHVAD